MAKRVLLDTGKRIVLSTDVTYEDLVDLYWKYISTYDEVPIFSKCDSKHNMPQGRIINKVIENENITYNEFLLQFGKLGRVRTNPEKYDLYLNKYIEISQKLGHGLTQEELFHNEYGLPQQKYFVKYCPDKSVKTFNDFVVWCGFKSNKLGSNNNRETVSQKLLQLSKDLGRPITKYDITLESVGFTPIVVSRIFGSLNKAKLELGLETTKSNYPLPFEEYKSKLDTVLSNISKTISRNYISWYDIENPLYSDGFTIAHKSLAKAFKREGVDIFSYIKEKGFMMNPSNFSYHYTFDDGERVVSTMEYDFSYYLKSIGLVYGKDYFRDVLYKNFSNATGKINCDYEIHIADDILYVEIAGIIYNCIDEDWKCHIYSSKQENDYKNKLIKKEKLLINSNKKYIFLFKDEMKSDKYKNILQEKIKQMAA